MQDMLFRCSLEYRTLEDWHRTIDTNLLEPICVQRLCQKEMNDGGAIVNAASTMEYQRPNQ